MSGLLSTTARRHVRLVNEARRAEMRRAFAILGGVDHDSAFDAFEKRLDCAPKKRKVILRETAEALHALPSCPALTIGLEGGAAFYAIYTVPMPEHPFSTVERDHSSVYAFMIDSRRKGYSLRFRPFASIADHMIGRIHERSDLDVPQTVYALGVLGRLSMEIAIRYSEGDEVFVAVSPELAVTGRVRFGWGEDSRGKAISGRFVDWRTALTKDMMSKDQWTLAEELVGWVIPEPQREAKATRTLAPDWIDRLADDT